MVRILLLASILVLGGSVYATDKVTDGTEINEDKIESGDLLLPDDDKDREKSCTVVCKKWQQDCRINSYTGTRRCHRACGQYAQECLFLEQ